jgi:hypothetical protein
MGYCAEALADSADLKDSILPANSILLAVPMLIVSEIVKLTPKCKEHFEVNFAASERIDYISPDSMRVGLLKSSWTR